MATKIEWSDEVWNPVTGCSSASEGCNNCYARRMSQRLKGRYGYPKDDPFRVTCHHDRLGKPLIWKEPRKVFVPSMGDLFHDEVQRDFRRKVFEVMCKADHHTYMILTKRPLDLLRFVYNQIRYSSMPGGSCLGYEVRKLPDHIWVGTSVENHPRANQRVNAIAMVPASVNFISAEPLLGEIDLRDVVYGDRLNEWKLNALTGEKYSGNKESMRFSSDNKISWVIAGAETGPGARPMELDWARGIRDQCVDAGVPFFFKKDSEGKRELDGRLWEQYPEVKS